MDHADNAAQRLVRRLVLYKAGASFLCFGQHYIVYHYGLFVGEICAPTTVQTVAFPHDSIMPDKMSLSSGYTVKYKKRHQKITKELIVYPRHIRAGGNKNMATAVWYAPVEQ